MKNDNKQIIKPKITIITDCVPKNEEEHKNNIRNFYDVVNEVIDNPKCFYTEKEMVELKKDVNKGIKNNISFI